MPRALEPEARAWARRWTWKYAQGAPLAERRTSVVQASRKDRLEAARGEDSCRRAPVQREGKALFEALRGMLIQRSAIEVRHVENVLRALADRHDLCRMQLDALLH